MSNINVIRNANVETIPQMSGDKGPVLTILVNGQYKHTFSPNSRESRMLSEVDINTIQQLLNGGTYVFSGGRLVDYRCDRHDTYKGFVQSDEAIKQLIEHIGFTEAKTGAYSRGVNGLYEGVRSRATNGAIFGGNGDPFDLEVPELGVGGDHDGHIVFGWSVFSDKVVTSLNVRRLVCDNGMIADAPFVTYEVPVINQWQENLDVVNARLKPVITDALGRRFKEMTDRAASLAQVLKAKEILSNRKSAVQDDEGGAEAGARLSRLSGILDPSLHLGHIVRESVYTDATLAAQVDGHLSQFDLYNILTEATTHYGRDEDTDRKANKLANTLVFDELKKRSTANFTLKPSTESHHGQAFMGEL